MNRRVRKAVPQAAAAVVVGDDYEQASGKPACAWRDPIARDVLVTRLINDALAVLAAVDSVDLDDTQQQLVGLLALINTSPRTGTAGEPTPTSSRTTDTDRPMVERTIAWLVTNGHRRPRHRGVDRNKIAFSTRAAAVNLKRLINLGLEHDGNTWNLTLG